MYVVHVYFILNNKSTDDSIANFTYCLADVYCLSRNEIGNITPEVALNILNELNSQEPTVAR